jgi:hypothetical protein
VAQLSTLGSIAFMKILMSILVLAVCVPAYAALPGYDSSRKWVETYCATNTPNLLRTIPKDERIFIQAADLSSGSIEVYHKSMTLKDVIITSPFVIIMRPGYESPLISVRDHPDFKIESMDVIYLSSGGVF